MMVRRCLSALLFLSLAACTSEEAIPSPTEEVFGLTSACAPVNKADEMVLVSPGHLVVEQTGQVGKVRFVLADDPPDKSAFSQWFVTSGLRAGDLVPADWEGTLDSGPLVITPLDELVADSPNDLLLALKVRSAGPILLSFAGVEYELDGQRYLIEDEFEFEVPCPG